MRIARAASQLIAPGESIVINCGSTAFLLGRELCGKPVQIITNYLPLANYLIDREHDSVIIMGGQYNRSHAITLSPHGSEKQPLCRALDVHQRQRVNRRGVIQNRYVDRHGRAENAQRGRQAGGAGRQQQDRRARRNAIQRAGQIDVVITGKQADAAILKQRGRGVSVIRV